VRVNVEPLVSDRGITPGAAGRADLKLTYDEVVGGQSLTVLKRFDEETGSYVYWSDEEGFNPRRWNPDSVRTSLVRAK
jgi:hypothetical protein